MLSETLVVGPFQCNCKIIVCPHTGEAAVIDPGDEGERILKRLGELKLANGLQVKPKWLLHTHGHLDHIAGTRKLKESLPESEICLHEGDRELYGKLAEQGKFFGFDYGSPAPIDMSIEDEMEISVGKLKLTAIHTPGHSPGSVCFRLHEDSNNQVQETLYAGDTLFQRSIGRTDLWGGDTEQLVTSIRTRLFTLDDDTPVCPGHGPDTRIGIEKRENPFVGLK